MSALHRILLVLGLLFGAVARAQFDTWQLVSQDSTQANLWGIAYGSGTLVAVGEQGTIVSYAYADAAWRPQHSGVDTWLVGIGFGNGRFVAVGDRGTILTSDDAGVTWTPRAWGVTARLNAAAYGNGMWIVVGEQGTVLTSPDGTTWTARPSLGSGFLRALAFGQGQFLIGGGGGALYSTADGVTFTPVRIGTTENIEGAAISANHFWVVGSNGLAATATQLGNWTFGSPQTNATLRGVTVRNVDEASAVGERAAAYWIAVYSRWIPNFESPPSFLATAVVQGQNELVAVGFGGTIAHATGEPTLGFIRSSPSPAVYGQPVQFTFVTGQGIQSYQWTQNGVAIPGATQASYTVPAATPEGLAGLALQYTLPPGTPGKTTQTFPVPNTVVPAGRPEVRDPTFAPSLPATPPLVVPQADGKLLVAGAFSVTINGTATYGLMRLNTDGSLDPTFRIGGGIPALTSVSGILVLPDGRILVRGSFSSIAGQARPGLARLNADGSVDATFAPDAAVAALSIAAWALAPDGRLYVQNGQMYGSGASIFRIGADGKLDPGFKISQAVLVGLDPQGRILAIDVSVWPGRLTRYLSDGTRDPGYTAAIAAIESYGIGTFDLASAVVTPSGVYGRTLTMSLPQTWRITRYLPDGGIDPNYRVDLGMYDTMSQIRPDGGVWISRGNGTQTYSTTYYSPAGTPDPSRYASLPNSAGYQILADAPEGTLITGPTAWNAPALQRIRPITGRPAKLTNLSMRAFVASADTPLIAGFVTRGSGSTTALVRGIGPGLAPYGVTDAMADPRLSLTQDGTAVAGNDDWAATLASRFSAVGAFSLTSGSKDAALESPVGAGNYTAILMPAPGDSGTGLAELYESDDPFAATREFVNVSARGQVTPGHPLIAGFAITGDVPVTVLIRAAGPALTAYGVTDALARPQLTLYRNSDVLWTNTTRPNSLQEISATTAVGAFTFKSGSNDSAMVVILSPGGYTAIATGVGDTSGTSLIEVYRVPVQ